MNTMTFARRMTTVALAILIGAGLPLATAILMDAHASDAAASQRGAIDFSQATVKRVAG